MKARNQLFKDARIQQQLETVWKLSSTGDSDANPGTITKHQYIAVHMKLSRALRADWELGVAQSMAEDDWQSDLNHYYRHLNTNGFDGDVVQLSTENEPRDGALRENPAQIQGQGQGQGRANADGKDGNGNGNDNGVGVSAARPSSTGPRGHRRQRSAVTGEEVMEKQCFLWSIFEVADHWTDSVEAEHYVVFLRKLFRRITALNASVHWEFQPMSDAAASSSKKKKKKKKLQAAGGLTGAAAKILDSHNRVAREESKHHKDNDAQHDTDAIAGQWTKFTKRHMFDLEEVHFAGSKRAAFLFRAKGSTKDGDEVVPHDVYLTANLETHTARAVEHIGETSTTESMWSATALKLTGITGGGAASKVPKEEHMRIRRMVQAQSNSYVHFDDACCCFRRQFPASLCSYALYVFAVRSFAALRCVA